MEYFSFKDLYEFIIPYINKSESFDEISINKYFGEIDNKIHKLYDDKIKLINSLSNNNIKFIIIYNLIIEILLFKILKTNPIEFYYLFDEKSVDNFIANNSITNIIHKPLNDVDIIEKSLQLNILTQVQKDDLIAAKKIRNNFSIAHPFNECIEHSYFDKYINILDKIKNIYVEFKIYDKNISLFISKISSGEYREPNNNMHEIIKQQLNLWVKPNKISDQLNFCLNKLFNMDNDHLCIDYPLLEFLLSEINTINIATLFFNYINSYVSKIILYKLDIKKLFKIYDVLLSAQIYFTNSDIYLETKKILEKFKVDEGWYYSFANVNSMLENKNLISYIIDQSEKSIDGFAINFYEWILSGNDAGIAYNICNFEQSAHANVNFFKKITNLLNSNYNSKKTKLQYRNEKVRYKFCALSPIDTTCINDVLSISNGDL